MNNPLTLSSKFNNNVLSKKKNLFSNLNGNGKLSLFYSSKQIEDSDLNLENSNQNSNKNGGNVEYDSHNIPSLKYNDSASKGIMGNLNKKEKFLYRKSI